MFSKNCSQIYDVNAPVTHTQCTQIITVAPNTFCFSKISKTPLVQGWSVCFSISIAAISVFTLYRWYDNVSGRTGWERRNKSTNRNAQCIAKCCICKKNKHSAPGAQKFKNRFNLCDLTRLKPLTFWLVDDLLKLLCSSYSKKHKSESSQHCS